MGGVLGPTFSPKGPSEGKANWRGEAVPIHPMRIACEVNEYMNRDDDIIVTDGGDATTWIGMSRSMRCAGHYLDYGLFGWLGGGIAYATVGFLVEKPDEIRPALDEAFASGKVACINVMSDPTAVSPGSIALANVGAYK